MIRLLPNRLPPLLSRRPRHTGRLRKRDNLLLGEGGGGAKSHDSEKAWSSIAHSKLSDCNIQGENLFLKIGQGHRRGRGNGSQGVTNLLTGDSDFSARQLSIAIISSTSVYGIDNTIIHTLVTLLCFWKIRITGVDGSDHRGQRLEN
jgi:hypothetical protein